MGTVAITVEGVIRRPIGGQPIPAGLDLYYGLATRCKLVLLTMDPEAEVEHWLQSEGMHEHVRVVYSDVVLNTLPLPEARAHQVIKARQSGNDVTLIVEPDPAVAAFLLADGYSTLLFTHASYAQPSWRPDYIFTPRPWDELADQVAHEVWLRAQDEAKKNAA